MWLTDTVCVCVHDCVGWRCKWDWSKGPCVVSALPALLSGTLPPSLPLHIHGRIPFSTRCLGFSTSLFRPFRPYVSSLAHMDGYLHGFGGLFSEMPAYSLLLPGVSSVQQRYALSSYMSFLLTISGVTLAKAQLANNSNSTCHLRH